MKGTHEKSPAAASAATPAAASLFGPWSAPICVAAATFLTYWPALSAGFLNWDDDNFLLKNPHYRGFDWSNVAWAFQTTYSVSYQPLTWLSYSLDYALWGMSPGGYHLTNVLLHVLNAVLLFFIAARLLKKALPGRDERTIAQASVVAALLFSLHPLRVETVAWASERKGVLSAFFYLLSVWSYLKAAERQTVSRLRWLAASLAFFGLGLLSKAVGIFLPVVLLFLDAYPLRRLPRTAEDWRRPWSWLVLAEKLPFFLMAFAAGVAGWLVRLSASSLDAPSNDHLARRAIQALYQPGFYLWKTLLPWRLQPLYPWPRAASALLTCAPAVALTLAVTAAAVFAWRRRRPAPLCAWACSLALLLPTLGLVKTAGPFAADRYAYLAAAAWALLAAGAWVLARERWGGMAAGWTATALLAVLSVLSWSQTQLWNDSRTLWDYVLSLEPDNPLANNNLGALLYQEGRYREAADHCAVTVRLLPDYEFALYNLANAYRAEGQLKEAVPLFRRALIIRPADGLARVTLGVVLTLLGRNEEAVATYRQQLARDPNDYGALTDMGNALAQEGKLDEAADAFTEALRIDPGFAPANVDLGRIRLQQGQVDLAITHLFSALKEQPDGPIAARASYYIRIAMARKRRPQRR